MNVSKALGKTLVASPERQQEADADRAVVQRVQAGDVAAFDQLIVKYPPERLYAVVYNMTSNREDTADLVQDAFIKAFQSINRFGGQSSFSHMALPHRGERAHADASPQEQAPHLFQP